MRFRFDDKKTAQAGAFLLSLSQGPLPYMQLVKLLYMADREMLLAKGIPITGDRMVAMKNGPVLSRVLDFITDGPSGSESAWFEYVDAPKGYNVSLKSGARVEPAQLDELSRYELGVLSAVFEKYGRMDKWELVELLHKILPEWSDPGRSAFNIEPEAILRADSRSEDEIRRVSESANELWLLGALDP